VSKLDHTLEPPAAGVRRLEVITGTGRRQQLFTWRRQARRHPLAANPNAAPAFVPAIVDACVPKQPDGRRKPGRRRRPGHVCGIIEVEIDGVTVRVARGADAKTVAMVIRALKAGA
jgi:transposase